VQQIQEAWLHVGDKWWSVDSMGTLPEQLSTWKEQDWFVQDWFVQLYYQIQDEKYYSALSHYEQPYGGSSKIIYWVQNIIPHYAHTIQKCTQFSDVETKRV
jgi:hypothetical protein